MSRPTEDQWSPIRRNKYLPGKGLYWIRVRWYDEEGYCLGDRVPFYNKIYVWMVCDRTDSDLRAFFYHKGLDPKVPKIKIWFFGPMEPPEVSGEECDIDYELIL